MSHRCDWLRDDRRYFVAPRCGITAANMILLCRWANPCSITGLRTTREMPVGVSLTNDAAPDFIASKGAAVMAEQLFTFCLIYFCLLAHLAVRSAEFRPRFPGDVGDLSA